MINLLRIELRKWKLYRQILYILLSISAIGLLTYLFSTDAIGADQTPVFIDLLVKSFFIIWEGVWLSKVIIEEYKSKSILVLFTMPIRMTKILISKVIFIFMISAGSMILAQLSLNGFFWVLSNQSAAVHYDIRVTNMVVYVFSSIMVALFGLLPLSIGLIRYSTTATLVTSIILLFVTSNSGMGFGALVSRLSFTIPFGIIGLCIVGITLKIQSKRDVIV